MLNLDKTNMTGFGTTNTESSHEKNVFEMRSPLGLPVFKNTVQSKPDFWGVVAKEGQLFRLELWKSYR